MRIADVSVKVPKIMVFEHEGRAVDLKVGSDEVMLKSVD